MTAPTILVTGAFGLLGPYLTDAAGSVGAVVASGRSDGVACDLTQAGEVRRLLDHAQPDIILHAAALTDVDACERDPARADQLNRGIVANVVAEITRETMFVLFSTDQVYPDSVGPHAVGTEDPVNAYGRSKLAGEGAARSHGRSLVLRTNLFGPSQTRGRESLSDFVARRLSSSEGADLFVDVLFSPLHMATLAALALEVAAMGLTGVFNAGSREGMSKYDFGIAVADQLNLPTSEARPARSDDLPARAPRPHDLRLDVGTFEASLGRVMPTLLDEVQKL